MKTKLLIILLSCTVINAHEKSIELLEQKVTEAAKVKDIQAISKVYDWTNVHFVIKDQEMLRWRSGINDFKDYIFKEVKWVPIEEFSETERKNMLTPVEIHGRVYKWNYEPVGRFDVTWNKPNKENHTYGGSILVGKNEKGRFVGISNMVVKADKK
ncbi:hypothetical protein HW115_19490 [Verrucomicrobiaceae bacterium N1E253]|uniref:Uncharacterized protein n=1 Tax=Oceaniferula marina TaxID=2748318 RepID=A0A851GL67_9BACT|nr:hypothetical protein [Oceaniferula marina]NWK57812.1 hypothetical protein [Oceaniferula marina]